MALDKRLDQISADEVYNNTDENQHCFNNRSALTLPHPITDQHVPLLMSHTSNQY